MTPRFDAQRIRAHALARPARLGASRLICLDGPAGAGKTTRALALAELIADSVVLHMDYFYDGWSGLQASRRSIRRLLGQLAHGRTGHWRCYDWATSRFDAWQQVPPGRTVILEGVGSFRAEWQSLISSTVWVDAPGPLRHSRGVRRDGDQFDEFWQRWRVQEQATFATERTRERADLRLHTIHSAGS